MDDNPGHRGKTSEAREANGFPTDSLHDKSQGGSDPTQMKLRPRTRNEDQKITLSRQQDHPVRTELGDIAAVSLSNPDVSRA